MKHANKPAVLLALTLCITLAGCGRTAATQGGAASVPGITADTPSPDAPAPTPASGQSATLYIGTKADGFTAYPMDYEGELSPELLIQGIADLTGWDLTLAEPVTTGKGGMSVCLSGDSTLFAGPPDPQKEAFHMYDAGQLAETLLDSIQKTLQMGFTGAGGDPDALDIYYYMEGDQALVIPYLDFHWPIDKPYQWTSAESN